MLRIITALIIVAGALSADVSFTEITADNAAKLLPEVLRLTHCASKGVAPEECHPGDFIGTAADLNGDGAPEFAIANTKADPPAEKRCSLYRDEKSGLTLIQAQFPCELKPAEGDNDGWRNIRGIIYPTGCEPQICDYTWTGAEYKQGSCEIYVDPDAACPVE